MRHSKRALLRENDDVVMLWVTNRVPWSGRKHCTEIDNIPYLLCVVATVIYMLIDSKRLVNNQSEQRLPPCRTHITEILIANGQNWPDRPHCLEYCFNSNQKEN